MLASSASRRVHPEDNMFRVMRANGQQRAYFISGYRNTVAFRNIVERAAPSLLKEKRVLDFGCGHGRMTRHFQEVFSPSTLVAADVLSSGVQFCSEEFGAAPFVISRDNPISNYPEKVDLIIAVSVFTHLPRDLFESTMAGLAKVLDSQGLMILTANGQSFIQRRNVELTDGFYFGNLVKRVRPISSQLPLEEYGQTCVSVEFMQKLLSELGLHLVEHIPDGHAGKQDVYVVRKRQTPAA